MLKFTVKECADIKDKISVSLGYQHPEIYPIFTEVYDKLKPRHQLSLSNDEVAMLLDFLWMNPIPGFSSINDKVNLYASLMNIERMNWDAYRISKKL